MKSNKTIVIMLMFIFGSLTIVPFIIQGITVLRVPWGFINDTNREAWISYYGSIIGGSLTLGGVWWTIKKQEEEKKMEFDISNCPLLNTILIPNTDLTVITNELNREKEWYLGYKINFKIRLQNNFPANSVYLIKKETTSLSEGACGRLWIFDDNTAKYLNQLTDEIEIKSSINFDPGFIFIENRNGASSSLINSMYFSFSNSFGNEYILKVTHKMRCHVEKKLSCSASDILKDYEAMITLQDGASAFFSECLTSTIIFNKKEIEAIKKRNS